MRTLGSSLNGEITEVEFADALARVPVTEARLALVQSYAAAPEGLTTPCLGRRMFAGKSNAHGRVNGANGDFAKALGKALGVYRSDDERELEWVPLAFAAHRDNELGHWQAQFWPSLIRAIERSVDWKGAWRAGVAERPKVASESNIDSSSRVRQRLERDRQSDFRRAILEAYGNQCAIAGHGPAVALEAAHIDRYADTSDNSIDNGILLRADLHKLFDKGYLVLKYVDEILTTRVHPEIHANLYRKLNGQPVKIPAGQPAPSKMRVDRHRGAAYAVRGW